MGSGKSLVAAELARRGGRLVSGDELGHEGLRQPAIRDRLAGRWGKEVLTESGEIDRRKVAALVFKNPRPRCGSWRWPCSPGLSGVSTKRSRRPIRDPR